MKIFFRLTTFLITLSMILTAAGCDTTVKSENLMDSITPNTVSTIDLNENAEKITNFGIELFKASYEEGKNILISPLSVLSALAMTANGAQGDTLMQIEEAFGIPIEELNKYIYSYVNSLPQGEKYKLSLANSIWFTNNQRFSVNKEFLQTNADYYGADIYKSSFDNDTVKDINNWVKNKTDNMIPKIIDDIPDSAVMYLVNALAFDAEWEEFFKKSQVKGGEFTSENGEMEKAEFMYSDVSRYLQDENAKGFIKYYSGNKYAFAALLPNEKITVNEYLSTLDGKKLHDLLVNSEIASVKTSIPKFETAYEAEMKNILKNMGIQAAFDCVSADFRGLGESSEGNIYIDKVLHKTYISVGEKGTKAGAATSIQMNDECVNIEPAKEVYLNRPFVYMLIDCETNIPFFIGTMAYIE